MPNPQSTLTHAFLIASAACLVVAILSIGFSLVVGGTEHRSTPSNASETTMLSMDQQQKTETVPIGEENPLLAEWTGPYSGVPPFDLVAVDQFKPALEAAMAEHLREIKGIAHNPGRPTFDNTFADLERAGRTLNRVQTVFSIWRSTMSSPELQPIEREMAPRLAAHYDRIYQNEPLFRRLEAVYDAREYGDLNDEQQRLAWLTYTEFVRRGARLDGPAKERLSAINQRLAALFTQFTQNVLADESDVYLVLRDEDNVRGLPRPIREAAGAAAEEKGEGSWLIMNTRSSVEPFLRYAASRDLRERAWRMWVNRGDAGDKNDNNAIISEIVRLRSERARLLGYPTHAHWRLENTMAAEPERAQELMETVWTRALAQVRKDVDEMQAIVRAEGETFSIQPWDYRYYAEKMRKARYDFDENELRPYLQLDRLRDAMFWIAGELFDYTFSPVDDVPVYHPDVRVWEVKDRQTDSHVGLWYFDPYARPGKNSGAWMNSYRRQESFDGKVTTIVSNNSNFVRSAPDEPVLISWNDAETLFHEFGHALHGLASDVSYPGLSGTSVSRDYVEFPSQLMEPYLSTPEVLGVFALHYETGEPIPQDLLDKMKRAATFNQSFETTEYLSSALLDMKLHLMPDGEITPDEFERETLREIGMPDEIVMRHRLPHFSHLFSGDSYSAGYYSYLWSDVLAADAYEAFLEAGDPYDPDVAERLRAHVFSVGNAIDPAEGYQRFRGRAPEAGALMRRRGFEVGEAE